MSQSDIENDGIFEEGDGFEAVLRVEIASDTPDKIRDARAKLVDIILEADLGDVMVTVIDPYRSPPSAGVSHEPT
jgi:hypothetical protein